mgnify:CR=1 FL=1
MNGEEEQVVDFVTDETDPKIVNQEIRDQLNQVTSLTQRYFNYRYNLLIYILVKNNFATTNNLEKATGFTRQWIYQIIDAFDKKLEEKNG